MKKSKPLFCTLTCITIIVFCCSCNNTTKNHPTNPIESEEDKNTEQSETVKPEQIVGTKEIPIPYRTTILYNGDGSLNDSHHTEITLLETIRGKDALDIILNASKYNSPPKEGQEYMLAKFRLSVLASKDDAVVDINTASFSVVSERGIPYNTITHISNLSPGLHEMYEGSSQEGFVCFTIDQTDNYPYLVFLSKYNNGLWFSTNPSTKLPEGITPYVSAFPNQNAINRDDYVKGSRKNPVLIEETIQFDGTDTLFDTYRADITLKEVIRGDKALSIISSDSIDMSLIDPSEEYLLAKFNIKSKNSVGNSIIELNPANFELVSTDGIKYPLYIVPSSADNVLTTMRPFSTQDGYVYFLVNKTDTAPKIVFLERNNRGLWFQTTK